MKIKIADSLFLDHTKSAFLGGDNHDSPSYFEWERSDPQNALFVTDSDIKHARGFGQIAWLLEPYELHPENYREAEKKGFRTVLTHNYEFVRKNGWLFYPHGGSRINFEKWDAKNILRKEHLFSMLISEKDSLSGHKLRHEIAKRYGNRIDVLGIGKKISAFDAYAPYLYSIVVENHQGSCFTERVIDCLSVGTVPIYWGCEDITSYFLESGIFRFDCMTTLEFLLRKLDRDVYRRIDFAIEENFSRAYNYAIVEDWLFRNYPHLFEGEE